MSGYRRRPEREHPQHNHFEAATEIGCQREVTLADQAYLIEQLNVFLGNAFSQREDTVGVIIPPDSLRRPLRQGGMVKNHQQLLQYIAEIRSTLGHDVNLLEQSWCIMDDHSL
jgi:hypothetical protein